MDVFEAPVVSNVILLQVVMEEVHNFTYLSYITCAFACLFAFIIYLMRTWLKGMYVIIMYM